MRRAGSAGPPSERRTLLAPPSEERLCNPSVRPLPRVTYRGPPPTREEPSRGPAWRGGAKYAATLDGRGCTASARPRGRRRARGRRRPATPPPARRARRRAGSAPRPCPLRTRVRRACPAGPPPAPPRARPPGARRPGPRGARTRPRARTPALPPPGVPHRSAPQKPIALPTRRLSRKKITVNAGSGHRYGPAAESGSAQKPRRLYAGRGHHAVLPVVAEARGEGI